jgi:hypothetical protein
VTGGGTRPFFGSGITPRYNHARGGDSITAASHHSPKGSIMKLLALHCVLVALLSVAGCSPPHYSVAVATSPTHITYAQRHHDSGHNDYLVDCKVDAQGKRSACQTVDLPAGE